MFNVNKTECSHSQTVLPCSCSTKLYAKSTLQVDLLFHSLAVF